MIHLTVICNILAHAKAPKVLSSHLAVATLIGCPKENINDQQPIAIQENIRRMVFKGLCKHGTISSKKYMSPIQLEVGVPVGSENAVHTLRSWYERNINAKGNVILKLVKLS